MEVTEAILLSQLKGLGHQRTQAGAVATLLLLLPRTDPDLGPVIAPYVGQLAALLADGAPDDASVQTNAAAVLGAVASLTDELHAAVDEAAAGTFERLLRSCGEASTSGGEGEGGGDGLAINVLSSVAQLAREQGRTLAAVSSQHGLSAMVACCARPTLAESALDALCAIASHDAHRPALRAAGAVPAAAAAVAAGGEPDAMVRALMLLGMLTSSSPEARGQLVEAAEGRGVVRLFGLARQTEDEDCKVIARDLLGLLTRDPETRAGVESAVRRAADAAAAAAAGGAPVGAAA